MPNSLSFVLQLGKQKRQAKLKKMYINFNYLP